MTDRARTNTAATSKSGIGGLLGYWYFFASVVVDWDIASIATAQHLEAFVTGSIAAFLGVGAIGGWNRDQPSGAVDSVTANRPKSEISPGDFINLPPGMVFELERYTLDIPLLRKELRSDEGVVYEIYLDSLGHKTAGIGRLITADMPEYDLPVGTKVEKETVERWFTEDVSRAIGDAQFVVDDFSSHPRRVQHALVNLAFNLGKSRLYGFKNTLALINARRYHEASIELLNSRYAEQVKNRAMRVSGWIASGETNLALT